MSETWTDVQISAWVAQQALASSRERAVSRVARALDMQPGDVEAACERVMEACDRVLRATRGDQ